MPEHPSFAAVDLGASSGRVVVGGPTRDGVRVTEVHRFTNTPVRLPSGLHWDITGIYQEILRGLRLASPDRPVSLGIDSWAVDYGLIDAEGNLLGIPYHHRDTRTDEVAPAVVRRVGADRLYAANGLQYLPFNTIFQLAAERDTARLRSARTLLLLPDLLAYWLTGEVGAEVTNASTTGLLDARSRTWSHDLAGEVGVAPDLLPALRSPGTRIGPLTPEAAARTGLETTTVTAVASHDTASAVLGVPATTSEFGYISCGTWSLAGLELTSPNRTPDARAANFTNELGVDGTTRFLRNIMGLWLVQETLRSWDTGTDRLPELLAEAAAAPPFTALLDPFDPRFLPPGDMPARIAEFCRETDQPVPEERGALLRCVLESLALAHRVTLRTAARLTGRDPTVVHIVGGGSRNELLCRLTADALDLPVLAGPVEATALGNLLTQARAAGVVADVASIRALLARTQPLRRYEPRGDQTRWDAAARRIGLA